MSTNDICWIAGLLEGEGNFIFHKTPTIQLNMVDLDTIDLVRKIVSPNSKINLIIRENKQTQYKLHICGVIAVQWMMTIYCKMSIRRQAKIREVIQNWKEMPRVGGPSYSELLGSTKRDQKKEEAIRAIMISRKTSKEEAAKILVDLLEVKGAVN